VPIYEDLVGGCLTYEEFVRGHSLAPLVDIKTACRIANLGHSRFYELARDGVFILIRNGSRTNVSAQNLHAYYLALIEGSRPSDGRCCPPSGGPNERWKKTAPLKATLADPLETTELSAAPAKKIARPHV
jgi:hypothetical protein